MVTSVKPTADRKSPSVSKKPDQVPNAPSKGTSLVDKLDGNQLVSVVSAMTDLGENVMSYRIEVEKTEQAIINARVRLAEIDQADRESERAYQNEAMKIQAQAALNIYCHEEAMEMLRQKHGDSLALIDLRKRYMTLLEQGKVTAQEFNAFMTGWTAASAPASD